MKMKWYLHTLLKKWMRFQTKVSNHSLLRIDVFDSVANWASNVAGIKSQEVVALMMDNKPEFIFLWLGLAKVHAVTAFINTNLRGKPLIHSLSISNASHFIIGIFIFILKNNIN
jgi:long-subunit acyl-CoA synthetase (AMP-forming)